MDRREKAMTIFEHALDFVADGQVIGLGSGRAAEAFIRGLGTRVRQGLRVRGVPTSRNSEKLATELGIPLVSLEEGMPLAVTVDGADEFDPDLNLIKGYGRALVREKVIAASSLKLVILVGEEKKVAVLGSRGKLPVEVLPFALPLCRRRLTGQGLNPVLYEQEGKPFLTDNGNFILDCHLGPIQNPAALENDLRAVPGVVGTGLFLDMADVVLVGDEKRNFEMTSEKTRK
jgi:ribose 5-phosphate isomerase A